MSDYDQAVYEDAAIEPRTSRLAIAALVCSLVCCQPFTTVLGVILGGVAMVRIGGNPSLRGRGLAIAAVLIGAVATGVHAYAVHTFYGPDRAVTAALAGDPDRCRAQFAPGSDTATDAEIATFAAQLTDRYGAYHGAMLAWPDLTGRKADDPFAYVVSFENATLDAEARFDMVRGKLRSLRIFDEQLGELQLPVAGDPSAVPGAAGPSGPTLPQRRAPRPGTGQSLRDRHGR